jgi:hypothetical protein
MEHGGSVPARVVSVHPFANREPRPLVHRHPVGTLP